MILGLGALLALFLALFVFYTIGYWRQIKNGEGLKLRQTFYGNFDRSIKTPLAAAKPGRAELEGGGLFLGNPNAKISIVEFVDFKCPNSKMAAPIMRQMMAQYGYKVKLTVRLFPSESIHPGANKFAIVAACAAEQGRFWEAHDALFSNQDAFSKELAGEDYKFLADTAYLDAQKLKECVDSGRTGVKVNRDYADGFRFGVQGTPTFFINSEKVEGVVPMSEWEKVLAK